VKCVLCQNSDHIVFAAVFALWLCFSRSNDFYACGCVAIACTSLICRAVGSNVRV